MAARPESLGRDGDDHRNVREGADPGIRETSQPTAAVPAVVAIPTTEAARCVANPWAGEGSFWGLGFPTAARASRAGTGRAHSPVATTEQDPAP